MIHTVKGFGVADKAEVDVFLELSCKVYIDYCEDSQTQTKNLYDFFLQLGEWNKEIKTCFSTLGNQTKMTLWM